jgi:hypothetical protein
MHFCPKHVENSVVKADDQFPKFADDFHHYFQIVCNSCGGRLFRLFVGDKRTVNAVCEACRVNVLVYDLERYPAATKTTGEETFSENQWTTRTALPVFVGYEYGEFDDDQEFDQNDITWCQIFVLHEGSLVVVFDDETA